MTNSTVRVAVVVLVLGGCAATAGCGVSRQSEPDRIDREDVPFGLLSQAPRADPSASVPGSSAYVIYLVGSNGLVATTRSQARPPTLIETLRSLVSGVTDVETAMGLRTDIPPDSKVPRVDVERAIATIDLGGSFDQVSDQARVVAFAQLVFTATESPAITHVRFELGGRPIDVPTAGGGLTGEPVSRDDYT